MVPKTFYIEYVFPFYLLTLHNRFILNIQCTLVSSFSLSLVGWCWNILRQTWTVCKEVLGLHLQGHGMKKNLQTKTDTVSLRLFPEPTSWLKDILWPRKKTTGSVYTGEPSGFTNKVSMGTCHWFVWSNALIALGPEQTSVNVNALCWSGRVEGCIELGLWKKKKIFESLFNMIYLWVYPNISWEIYQSLFTIKCLWVYPSGGGGACPELCLLCVHKYGGPLCRNALFCINYLCSLSSGITPAASVSVGVMVLTLSGYHSKSQLKGIY